MYSMLVIGGPTDESLLTYVCDQLAYWWIPVFDLAAKVCLWLVTYWCTHLIGETTDVLLLLVDLLIFACDRQAHWCMPVIDKPTMSVIGEPTDICTVYSYD